MPFQRLRFMCTILFFCTCYLWGVAQQDQTPIFKGPQDELVDVPLVNTEPLEPVVARQIRGYQNSLQKIAKISAEDPVILARAYGMLGQGYQAYTWIEPARRCYQNAAFLDPKKFAWHYLLGLTELELGNVEGAEESFKKAEALRPDYLANLVQLGKIRLQFNDGLGAVGYFEKVLAKKPNEAAAWLGKGQALYYQEKYNEALKAYGNALKLSPASDKINYFIALTYRALGDEPQSRGFMARAGKVGVKPIDPLAEDVAKLQRGERVLMQKGQAAFSAGRYKDAAQMYSMALDSNPNSIPARVNLASSLALGGFGKEAIEQYQAVLAKDPKNLTSHYNLGKIYSGLGKLDEAFLHLSQAVNLDNQDLEIQYDLANVLATKGEIEKALRIYDHLEAKAPDQVKVPIGKVRLAISQKAYDQALDMLGTYRKKFPHSATLGYYHAQLLVTHPDLSKRNGKLALDLSLKLLEAQKSALHFESVAMAHAELGNCLRAAKWQTQALEFYRQSKNKTIVELAEKQLHRYQKQSDCRVPGK